MQAIRPPATLPKATPAPNGSAMATALRRAWTGTILETSNRVTARQNEVEALTIRAGIC